MAAAEGQESAIAQLALLPLDPNEGDKEGNAPLILAAAAGKGPSCLREPPSQRVKGKGAFGGHDGAVKALLRGFPGLAVDAANGAGFTALIQAAIHGHDKCARLLLAAGRAHSSLPSSSAYREVRGVARGADTELRDGRRRLTALEWAEYCGSDATAFLLRHWARRRSAPSLPSPLLRQG